MAQITEGDYRALCRALEAWLGEPVATRDEQFQWYFVGAYCSDADEWVRVYDTEHWLDHFLLYDAPERLHVAFYVRALANGRGEFTVLGQAV